MESMIERDGVCDREWDGVCVCEREREREREMNSVLEEEIRQKWWVKDKDSDKERKIT